MKRVIVMLSLAVLTLTGCGAVSGVVTGASGSRVDSLTPDIRYITADGRAGSFDWARFPIAVVAFTAPEGLDPTMVHLADQLADLPVTVAQFSLPSEHGLEAGPVGKSGMIVLYDTQRIAWNAYGRPEVGALMLIGENGRILMTGSLRDPSPVLQEARRLGEIEKQRRQAEEESLTS